jgi:orotidine-5'-phosphate decarboxylase
VIQLNGVVFLRGKLNFQKKLMPTNNQEIARAAEQIEKHLAPANLEGPVDPAELCKTYNEIKGSLVVILPGLRLIPVFGSAVASGLQLLMSIADQLCPVK